MVLDAQVELTSIRGTRTLPAREFFVDFQLTALEPGEFVTAIEIPFGPSGSGHGYVKMSSLAENDWPVASIAALLEPAGAARRLRIGVGALAPTPCFVAVDVAGLSQQAAVDAAITAVESILDPLPDVRGSVSYKRRLGRVATEDAVRLAWKDSNDE
jgi:carbon-monoxide dehydrogenase medium subunit